MKKVAILMGSDSDLPIVEKGINVLRDYGIPFEVHVYSAHRTPLETAEFVSAAYENGFGVIIAAAGMAAHLAGAVAANTVLPVIGIPISCKNTGVVDGSDALGHSRCYRSYRRRGKRGTSRGRDPRTLG